MIPEIMTFEGRNFDIIIGISAPIVGLLHIFKIVGSRIMLVWNILGLIFVLIIMTTGILAAELPFQQLAFDQPNRGLGYYPFVLLPGLIVPIVIWMHITDIIVYINRIKNEKKR